MGLREILKDEANKKTIRFGLFAFGLIGVLYLLSRYVLGDGILNWIWDTPKVFWLIYYALYTVFMCMFEAWHFHYKATTAVDKTNQHPLLNLIRLVAWIPVVINVGWVAFLVPVMHPFWHDGWYYTFRHRINRHIYEKKFFAQSTTSTAVLTKYMTPVVRTILFAAGLALYVML